MNFLKAEIENKRKILESVHSEEQEQKKKKYVRRSDVEKKREQQYLAEQAEIEKKREVLNNVLKLIFCSYQLIRNALLKFRKEKDKRIKRYLV